MTDSSVSLTEEQIAEYKEAFQLFDKDGDGSLQLSEVGTVMRSLGQSPTEAELRDILAEIEKQGHKKVDFALFQTLMAKNLNHSESEDEIKEAFRVFDSKGLGLISVGELKHILLTLGEKLTDDEVEEMMNDAYVDAEGNINYEELVKMMIQAK
eukprot:TRINITY_DN10191_c0_g1_i1.p1 TRINITY_DN10191_c0_g1~~TRINITY_DN10191_c0_g1_i1.p1  ORF type:complete len:168 (-),score=48.61 TRINITY_DN10191_c0_g1_i1:59-520(-)